MHACMNNFKTISPGHLCKGTREHRCAVEIASFGEAVRALVSSLALTNRQDCRLHTILLIH